MPRLFITVAVLCAVFQPSVRAQIPVSAAPPGPGYADLADLVLAAPVIADATIRSVARIRNAESAGVAPGHQRLYVTADVAALIRGANGAPPRIGYLVDVALGTNGRFNGGPSL